MRESIKNIFKKIGIYYFLVGLKGEIDKIKILLLEKQNSKKRYCFYKSFLKEGNLVFDVGANIGNRVVAFLKIRCMVVAVEPQQDCIRELRRKFGKRIEIVEKGLGEKEEQKTLYISDVNTISSISEDWIESVKQTRFKQHQWNRKAIIELTTLDNLIKKYGLPQFCKIDVEGYELEVLKGLSYPIPNVSFEYTVPEQTQKLMECLHYCNKLSADYKYNYSIGENMKLELEKFISYNEFIIFVQSNTFLESDFGDIYLKL